MIPKVLHNITGKNKRVLHLIRHAESELNVKFPNATEGYFAPITSLDAKLSDFGEQQSINLRYKIENENENDPFGLRQANIVITSPLSRAIRTAQLSMPQSKYKYKVRFELTEQIENTTDIGYHKSVLSDMYPGLRNEFNELPEAWWYKPYNNNNNNNNHDPEIDANILIKNKGKMPFSESKYNVRKRIESFLKLIYFDKDLSNYENIVLFSHSLTIKEFELLLLTIKNEITDENANQWNINNQSIRQNTELVSFELPKNANQIDWNKIEERVNQAKGIVNHAGVIHSL